MHAGTTERRCMPTKEPHEGKLIGGCGSLLIEHKYKGGSTLICPVCDSYGSWPKERKSK